MNIVFFSRYFYPHIGGVEKHVANISEILKKKHTIAIVTEQYDTSLPLVDYIDGITIYRIPYIPDTKKKKYKVWEFLFENRRIIQNADIIHIHDVFYWYFPFRFMYPSKKVFMTFHGYEGNSLPSRKAILSHKIAEKLSIGNICIGDYLSKWYGTKPDIVSYGAIEPQNTHILADFSYRSSYKILYIGRLEKEAGILEYLQLLRLLVKRKYKIKLTVLGDGSMRKRAESYVKKYNLPVSFFGFVPHVELYTPRFDVVFTSRFLGTMEALAAKKPVFCIYNNDIKRDCFVMAPFGSYIFLSDSVLALADMFDQMVSDVTKTEKSIHAGYSWVRHETWEKMVKQYRKLWNI